MPLISAKEAVNRLKQNQVVAVPTETVYGLAGRISSPTALRAIFTTKERPLFDPLIVHVFDQPTAKSLAREWPAVIDFLTRKFWPGPLTVVVPKADTVDPLITSGLDSVGLRAPAHPIAQQILSELNEPFAAPSANRFGRTSPTRAEHVVREFQDQVAVVDGGASDVGLESTVIRFRAPDQIEILRPGGVSEGQLRLALAPDFLHIQVTRSVSQASPGHLEHHYQPTLPLVILHAKDVDSHRRLLAEEFKLSQNEIFELKLPHDPRLAARELYNQLHILSQNARGLIWFHADSRWQDPAWDAIKDRLSRASTKQVHQE